MKQHIKSIENFNLGSDKIQESSKDVDHYYDKIIEEIKKAARKLNDNDAFELHERLKKFFERAF